MGWPLNVDVFIRDFAQSLGLSLATLVGLVTLLAMLIQVVGQYRRRVGRKRIVQSLFMHLLNGVVWLALIIGMNSLLLWERFAEVYHRNLLSFIDTPREILVVSGSLALILCSIACTIYFRPARMTVIAGVAFGFIAAVLFAEGVFAAHEYMNRRVVDEKAKLIEVPKSRQ